MHFNYYFLIHLTDALAKRLIGMKMTDCYSQNKNELILQFSAREDQFNIKALLDNEIALLQFPTSIHRAKKNSVDLFKELLDQKITHLHQYKNERAFSIGFGNDYELIFKLHGRRSNLLLFQKNKLISIFKSNLEKDMHIVPTDLERIIDQSDESLIGTNFDLKSVYPTFDKHCYQYLSGNQFEGLDQANKLNILKKLLSELHEKEFYVRHSKQTNLPYLSLVSTHLDELLEQSRDPIEIANEFAMHYLSEYHFAKMKKTHLARLQKEIKKTTSYINTSQSKLASVSSHANYEELANIIMANLHLPHDIKAKEITLFDFYNDGDIKIKLKPDHSLQKSAEWYYKKAKNQHKEINTLSGNIAKRQNLLAELVIQSEKIMATVGMKELKQILPEINQKKDIAQEKNRIPFMVFCIDGFDVWIGRNAANNDLLTQKYARKDDIWLHARDVAGSHTVIRKKDNKPISLYTIEKVAQMAAWYSKRKHDTLCPVIYTQKKYVRKPKGSHPGQVLVSREEVILVKPCQNVQ